MEPEASLKTRWRGGGPVPPEVLAGNRRLQLRSSGVQQRLGVACRPLPAPWWLLGVTVSYEGSPQLPAEQVSKLMSRGDCSREPTPDLRV